MNISPNQLRAISATISQKGAKPRPLKSDEQSKPKQGKVAKLKERKCNNKECRKQFTPHRHFQRVCSPICALAHTKAEREKAERGEWNARKKVYKEKNKKLSEYEEDAKKVFQKWVRKRDEGAGCISCGSKTAPDWSGGHYFDAGIYSGLIFHEDNCSLQCNSHCNGFLHGNKANYRIGLVKKIGEERVRWLEENKDRLRNYKYTKQELTDIKNKYLKLLKENRISN